MKVIVDEKSRIILMTDELDEFNKVYTKDRIMSIECAVALKKQIEDAIDIAVKEKFGFGA